MTSARADARAVPEVCTQHRSALQACQPEEERDRGIFIDAVVLHGCMGRWDQPMALSAMTYHEMQFYNGANKVARLAHNNFAAVPACNDIFDPVGNREHL